jgi:hypothetical protein
MGKSRWTKVPDFRRIANAISRGIASLSPLKSDPFPPKVPRMKTISRLLSTALLAALLALLATGCASLDKRTQRLALGMSKDQATSLLGSGYKLVGARETVDSRKAEVIRYDDPKYGELLLYFRDNKLVQWGDIRILDNMPDAIR